MNGWQCASSINSFTCPISAPPVTNEHTAPGIPLVSNTDAKILQEKELKKKSKTAEIRIILVK